MVSDKSCPGSRTIRQPVPENVVCPHCNKEVEIWSDELRATCPNCGTRVFREQQPSCIDWCPHAKECVGPEIYERLKSGIEVDTPETNNPLDIITREHERILENLNLLRAASLCLRLGNLTPESPVRGKGIDYSTQALDFLNKELRLHFHREEKILFPVLERHIGVEKSPTQLLLEEHGKVWQYYNRLKEKLAKLPKDGSKPSPAILAAVQENSSQIIRFLEEHIKNENESLLPLSESLLKKEELDEIASKWKALGS